MANNFSRAITITGWANLDDLFQTEVPGYQGGMARSITILNNNAAICYLHFTDSGTQPTVAAEGMPISTATASAPASAFTQENVDLAGIWINTPSALNINFAVIGV